MRNRKNDMSETMEIQKTFTLIGADKRPYVSITPGTLGGHRKTKVYGRMDCPAAIRALNKGG